MSPRITLFALAFFCLLGLTLSLVYQPALDLAVLDAGAPPTAEVNLAQVAR